MCVVHLKKKRVIIRELAKWIGNFVASFPGVPLGPSHYRNLGELKSCGLKANKGNFDALISYTAQSKDDIIWWRDNKMHSKHILKNLLLKLLFQQMHPLVNTIKLEVGVHAVKMSVQAVDGPKMREICILSVWSYWQ